MRPVGGKTAYKTNCRLVASTNRKTDEAIKEGKLREDLFYRISAISVNLPPLRDRRDDIMPLVDFFKLLNQMLIYFAAPTFIYVLSLKTARYFLA